MAHGGQCSPLDMAKKIPPEKIALVVLGGVLLWKMAWSTFDPLEGMFEGGPEPDEEGAPED